MHGYGPCPGRPSGTRDRNMIPEHGAEHGTEHGAEHSAGHKTNAPPEHTDDSPGVSLIQSNLPGSMLGSMDHQGTSQNLEHHQPTSTLISEASMTLVKPRMHASWFGQILGRPFSFGKLSYVCLHHHVIMEAPPSH